MRRTLVAWIAIAAVLLGAGLLLASCGSDDESTPATETTTTTTTTTTTEPPTTTTTPPAPPGPTAIRIRVVDGAPQGGIVRQSVEQGDRVVVVVTSDVSDHVHVHGYDLMRDVGPGMRARIPFRATIPGRFEIELEDRGLPIAELTVTP